MTEAVQIVLITAITPIRSKQHRTSTGFMGSMDQEDLC